VLRLMASDATAPGTDGKVRCVWCLGDALYIAYHDEEWGVPVHDDRALFERLLLEGFQAGLSWRTILAKRDNFFRAFDGWDPETIAAYGPDDLARLMADPGIVRNRLKVNGAVKNAQAFLRVVDETGSFDRFIWQFTGGDVLRGPRATALGQIPVTTPESDAMSKELKRRGFTFIGSTICYAFMQSVGMVEDHIAGCWRATG
jgi:DNA-3-methyladenine glycosylase I